MPEPDDHQLLAEFVRTESETAFAVLVGRYVNLVYSTAFRFTGNAHHAEEITQAVFIILARKAERFSPRVVLSGWLYQAARLTSANFVKNEIRRQRREQEVYMQSALKEPHEAAWRELAPLLDEAMGRLGDTDRDAVVLRFFENKNSAEIGAALRMNEEAARRRVNRAVEKLRRYFSKRGVNSTTAIIAGAISANSVQAAPAGMVNAISAVAMAKGAAASASTLTLVKGALKIMAWTKTQTTIAVGIGILLAAGTTSITVREIQKHMRYPWQVPKVNRGMIRKFPPQAVIVPTAFDQEGGYADYTRGGGAIGICQSVTNIVQIADPVDIYRMVISSGLPQGQYDYFARGKNTDWGQGWEKALQMELKSKLGVIEKPEMRDTDVLLLEYKNPNAGGLLPPGTLIHSMGLSPRMRGMGGTNFIAWFVSPISSLQEDLQGLLEIPVVDRSGLTGNYDFKLIYDPDRAKYKESLKHGLYDQLGFVLVPTNMPYEMLVVEKAN